MSSKYWPRIADALLAKKVQSMPAVLVRGPKWIGKTSSCEQLAKSSLMLRNPDTLIKARETAAVQPSLLLSGDRPRLIDEWQVLPILWDSVISECDIAKGAPAQFLLTGSATPVDIDQLLHTGVGRISRLSMSTMTLEETQESTKQVSLARLFEVAGSISGQSSLSIEEYVRIVCRGGWPSVIAEGAHASIARDYLEVLCESDIAEATGTRIDPTRARALVRSIARNVAQAPKASTFIEDIQDAGISISEPTLREYLGALRRLFVLEEIPAWSPALRSKTPLRTSKVMHLADPSLAAAAVDATPDKFLEDLGSFGYFFESLCVHDLLVYARAINGELFYYRDKTDLEVDSIISLPDGSWGAIEIKLGGEERINEAANNLLKLKGRVATDRMGEPNFLMVLTAGTYAYTREDSVHVCPLGCLAS